MKWWDRRLVKEIVSKDGELHFRRWKIFETKRMNLYVHRIYKADEDEHLHNHPWNFAVFCLNGSYGEQVKPKSGDEVGLVFVRPWSFRKRTKSDFHKIRRLFTQYVTTIVLTWGEKTVWGYEVDGEFIDFEKYRDQKNFDKKAQKYADVQRGIDELKEMARVLKMKTDDPAEVKKTLEKLVAQIEEQKAALEKLKGEKQP